MKGGHNKMSPNGKQLFFSNTASFKYCLSLWVCIKGGNIF